MTVGFTSVRERRARRQRGRRTSRDRAQRLPVGDQRCTVAASASVFRRSRSSRSDSISAISDRISRWRWVAASGTSRKISRPTGSSSGASKAIGLLHPQHRGERVLQALDPAVRNRHAVAEAGGAQALASEQVVGDGGAGDRVLVLEQQAGVLERALLAGGVDIDQHVAGGQDGSETIHRIDAGRPADAALGRR